MSDMKAMFEAELARLRDVASKAGDPRLSAILLAASDESVRNLLWSRFTEGHHYIGVRATIAVDRIEVVFEFGRAEDKFGLLPLGALVTVNVTERRVIAVVDNYLSPPAPGTLQPELDLGAQMHEGPPSARLRAEPKDAWSKLSHWV